MAKVGRTILGPPPSSAGDNPVPPRRTRRKYLTRARTAGTRGLACIWHDQVALQPRYPPLELVLGRPQRPLHRYDDLDPGLVDEALTEIETDRTCIFLVSKAAPSMTGPPSIAARVASLVL